LNESGSAFLSSATELKVFPVPYFSSHTRGSAAGEQFSINKYQSTMSNEQLTVDNRQLTIDSGQLAMGSDQLTGSS
jgi:hypothetical protein